MSADNWGVCPRCYRNEEDKVDKLRDEVNDSYGKVSREEFLELLERSSQDDFDSPMTLREDWSIGVDDFGKFGVEYRASCDKCGLKFEYMYEEEVTL